MGAKYLDSLFSILPGFVLYVLRTTNLPTHTIYDLLRTTVLISYYYYCTNFFLLLLTIYYYLLLFPAYELLTVVFLPLAT